MNKTFCAQSRPLLVGSIRHRTPDAAISDIKASEADGATAFILHIQLMDEQHRNFDAFREIAASTNYPIMAINYRREDELTDEQRLSVQAEAIRAGFTSIDIRADTYDNDSQSSLNGCNLPFASANPKEITMRPDVIAKQKEIIDEFHKKGTEVLMSAHVNVELTDEQAISLALEMEARGADIVKIITSCQSPEHALHILHTTAELKKRLNTPFLYSCNGSHGSLTRPIAPLFGSMLVFGHHDYAELSNREKPLLKDMKELYRVIEWRM